MWKRCKTSPDITCSFWFWERCLSCFSKDRYLSLFHMHAISSKKSVYKALEVLFDTSVINPLLRAFISCYIEERWTTRPNPNQHPKAIRKPRCAKAFGTTYVVSQWNNHKNNGRMSMALLRQNKHFGLPVFWSGTLSLGSCGHTFSITAIDLDPLVGQSPPVSPSSFLPSSFENCPLTRILQGAKLFQIWRPYG